VDEDLLPVDFGEEMGKSAEAEDVLPVDFSDTVSDPDDELLPVDFGTPDVEEEVSTPGSWMSKVVPRAKILELAKKHKASEEEVRSLLSMRGAITESLADEERQKTLNEQSGFLDIYNAAGKSTAEAAVNVLPGIANSIAFNIPWKLKRDSSKNPALFDEIEKLADEKRGYLQKGSELLLEFGIPGGAGAKALKSMGITAKTAAAAQKARAYIDGAFRGGKYISPAVSGAIQLAPTAATTGAVGALAGYGAARRGDELEAMRDYGMMFAAIPYAGTIGAKVLAKVGEWPANKLAQKLQIGKEKMLANVGKYEDEIMSRASTEDNMLDLALRKSKIEDVSDAELGAMYSVLSKGGPNIKTILKELREQGYKGDLDRRAKEIVVRTQVDKKLAEFGDGFVPLRTAIDKSIYNVNDTINEYSQLESLGEMGRFLKYNRFIDKGLKTRWNTKINEALRSGMDEAGQADMLSNIKSSLTTEWLQPRLRALASDEGAKLSFSSIEDVRNYLSEVNRTFGDDPEYLKRLWKAYRVSDVMREGMKDVVRNYKWGGVEKLVNFITPKQFVLDSIDRRFGTPLALHHQKLMRKLDGFQFVADGVKEDILSPLVDDYKKFTDKLPTNFKDERLFMHFQEDSGKKFLTRARELGLYDGEVSKMSAEDAARLVLDDKTLASYREFSDVYGKAMDRLRIDAEHLFGIKIAERQNYFRHQLVDSEKAYGRILNLYRQVGENIPAKMDKKAHSEMLRSDYNYRQLILSLRNMYSLADMKMPNGFGRNVLDDAVNQLEHLSQQQLGGRMSPIIYSAYKRQGGMPDLLRETDPIKVAESWINNTLRAKFTREELADISKYIPTLEKLGATSDAEYLKDYVRVAMGKRADFFGDGNTRMRRVRQLAEKYADTPEKWEQMVDVPNQVQSIFSTALYANLLSSPITAMRNLEQVPFVAATELGGAFGQRKAMQAAARMSAKLAKKGYHFDDLHYLGKLPPQMQSEIHSDLLRPKTKLDVAENLTKKYARATLWLFGKAETANRLISMEMAQALADDIYKRTPDMADALASINKIASPALRKNLVKLAEAIPAGGKKARDRFADAMEDYMLERTQFFYNKGNISQAAEILGPLLSSFTRFTTEIQGDIVNKLRDGKTKEMLEKYLYPAVYMSLFMNGLYDATEQDPQWKNRVKALIGTNLATHVPGAGAMGLLGLARNPAPALDMAYTFGEAVLGRDPKTIKKAIDGVLNFAPAYKPLQNWVGKFGYRVLGGAEEDPITEGTKELVKPVTEFLGKERIK
jgi:hypothetical protein